MSVLNRSSLREHFVMLDVIEVMDLRYDSVWDTFLF